MRVRHAREMATFEIEDTGPGITEAEMQRIFEPFARGSAAQHAAGAGLGLTISRMFVDLMGGQLEVDSARAGSIFRIRLFLPHLHSAEAARVLPRVERQHPGPRRRIPGGG